MISVSSCTASGRCSGPLRLEVGISRLAIIRFLSTFILTGRSLCEVDSFL